MTVFHTGEGRLMGHMVVLVEEVHDTSSTFNSTHPPQQASG
jgi:hypothetical protein